MSDNEIVFLASGATLGVYLMLALQMVFQTIDDRRDRRRLAAKRARLARDRAANNWRTALADVQAAVDTAHTNMLTGLDRLQAAIRKEGM